MRSKRQHNAIPSRSIVSRRFDIRWQKARSADLPILVGELRGRRRYNDFLNIMVDATAECQSPDDLPEVMAQVQGALNGLAMRNGQNALIDVTSPEYRRRLISEIAAKRRQESMGVMTGFPTLDRVIGGLQAGRMVVCIGRAGSYKSWMNLFFVAEAVMQGKKVLLYPLEMTIYETMMRLYTIFSQKMFGGKQTFRNLDLSKGRINKAKFLKFLDIINERYNGQLLLADVAKIEGSYTIERIEAEVEVHQPHMFWIDYLTLMKAPSPNKDAKDWQTVATLSSGVKGIALRQNVIGGASAQVNREFMKARSKLPRLEHISFGDSLAADADQVISLAKLPNAGMMYGLVKNRHGPEIGPVTCKTGVNIGDIEEIQTEDDDED